MLKRLLPLILLPIVLLQANWRPIEHTPYESGPIIYGDGYVWCFVPIAGGPSHFYAYQTSDPTGWYELNCNIPGEPNSRYEWAIAYEYWYNKRIFVVGKTIGNDQLFIYTRYNTTSIDGYWNQNPIYLPSESPECGPGVSIAYQPVSENGYLIGGYLYLLIGGNSQKFYRRFIADTAVPPRGNMREDWEPLADIDIEVQAGGAMCYNHNEYWGTEHAQDSLFVFVGGGRTEFFSYWTSQGTWNPEEPTEQPQWGGSSITSGVTNNGSTQLLYAILGESQTQHFRYRLSGRFLPNWRNGDPLPAWIYPGSYITCKPAPINFDWAYLLLPYWPPEYNTNFFINTQPWSDEDLEEGSQSAKILPNIQKAKISYHHNRIEIRYTTEAYSRAATNIYNLSGKHVKTLIADNFDKGEHQIIWDKTDNSSRKVPYGIYFITIDKENKPERVKVVIR